MARKNSPTQKNKILQQITTLPQLIEIDDESVIAKFQAQSVNLFYNTWTNGFIAISKNKDLIFVFQHDIWMKINKIESINKFIDSLVTQAKSIETKTDYVNLKHRL
jgi:hypothetical protein